MLNRYYLRLPHHPLARIPLKGLGPFIHGMADQATRDRHQVPNFYESYMDKGYGV